jgi:hypothetical protein
MILINFRWDGEFTFEAAQQELVILLGQPNVGDSTWFRPRGERANPQMPIKIVMEWEIRRSRPTFGTAPNIFPSPADGSRHKKPLAAGEVSGFGYPWCLMEHEAAKTKSS